MERKLAHPVHRLVAYLIDQAVCVGLFIFLASRVAVETDFYRLMDSSLGNITIYMYFLALWPLLNALLISRLGGTVGKLLTGTRIEANGKNLSFLMAIFRNYIGYIVSGTITFLGFFWILIDKNRQGWHDMMVDSVVTIRNKHLIWLGVGTLLLILYFDYVVASQIISDVLNLKLF